MEIYMKRQLLIVVWLYLGQMITGFGLGWTAPAIPKLQDPKQSPLTYNLTDTEISLVGSLLYAGNIVGPYLGGLLSNAVGRRPCLCIGGIVTTICYLLLALSHRLSFIYAGRVLNGLGSGMIFVMSLVYIGEIASTNIRGLLLTGTGMFCNFGILLVYVIGPYVPYSALSYICLAMTSLYVIGTIFIPETPLFYVMKGEDEKATKVLRSLGRVDDMEQVFALKYNNNVTNKSQKPQFKRIWTVASNRRALLITVTLTISQHMSGIITVMIFATTIFEISGSSIQPHLGTIIIGTTQVAASITLPFLVERCGRKILLMFSTASCCLSLGFLGGYFYLHSIGHPAAHVLRWSPLLTLIIFFISYNMGLGTIPLALIAEMFEPNLRSIGSAISITTGWLCGFATTTAFGYVIGAFGGHVAFWFFACVCGLAFVFTTFFVPETKGKTLLEIQNMMS